MNCLIVGLGNPGKKYVDTRHNLGFSVVEAIATRMGLRFRKSLKLKASIAGAVDFFLAKPQTYMNLSGVAVKKIVEAYQVPLKGILVVTDDIALPFGSHRLRLKGSSGGHNGLKSIEGELKTVEYARLRMGIGCPDGDISSYVLEKFSEMEKKILPEIIDKALGLIDGWLKKGK